MIQEEYLLSRTIMQELCTEAAKLKILGAMEMIPNEKLVRLLNMLELNIRGGDRVSPISDVKIFSCFIVLFLISVLYCRKIVKVFGSIGKKQQWRELWELLMPV